MTKSVTSITNGTATYLHPNPDLGGSKKHTHTQKNENTWSEYHTQHTITDSLSFTAAKKHGSFVA